MGGGKEGKYDMESWVVLWVWGWWLWVGRWRRERQKMLMLIYLTHLLYPSTGSNFDDGMKKTTGGRNGCVGSTKYISRRKPRHTDLPSHTSHDPLTPTCPPPSTQNTPTNHPKNTPTHKSTTTYRHTLPLMRRYGAKLANIFSTRFTIETADRASGKKYRQTFRDNMTVRFGVYIYV